MELLTKEEVKQCFTKRDTIPKEVKEHFWKDIAPPDLNEYNVIGFDADHCLVKYNVQEMLDLIILGGLQDMVELGYPKQILDFDLNEKGICLNASVFDIDNGTILRLGENKEILGGMKGFRVMSNDELQQIYGNPPTYTSYKWPQTNNITPNPGGYWCFITFFDIPKVVLFLAAVDLKEKGIIKRKSYYDITLDVRTIIYKNYIHFNANEVKPIENYGRYFPQVVNNPEKYIQPQPELKEILKGLKEKGKKLFLATNSHYDYTKLIMQTTLGEDWQQYFDIICSYSRKPEFFWEAQVLPPFFSLDTSQPNYKGNKIDHHHDLQHGQVHLEGNSRVLHKFFQKLLNQKDIKVGFFGDQYITDCHHSSTNDGWDSFAVIEEMMHYDESYAEGVDPRLIKYDKYWGDHYFFEHFDNGIVKRNYFLAELEKSARYALPLIKCIKHWL